MLAPEPEVVPSPVVIRAQQVEALQRDFARRLGVAPTSAQEAALIEQVVDEELLLRQARELGLDRYDRSIRHWLIRKLRFVQTGSEDGPEGPSDEALYQEALDLGLDRDDPVIRRMLSHKMQTLASQPPPAGQLSEAELRDFLARNRDRYRQPARLWLTQVFVSGTDADARSQALIVELRRESTPSEVAAERGDVFLLGHAWDAKTETQLAKLVGAETAQEAFACTTGEWCGPVRSPYGLHLLWVERHEPERDARLDEVRSRVVEGRRVELREQRLEAFLEELRARYTVVVERPSDA